MVILATLLVSLVLLLAAIIIGVIFKPKGRLIGNIAVGAFIASVVLGVLSGILAADFHAQTTELEEEGRVLVLYGDTINASTDEYVRFDFYQRVQEYNENRKGMEKMAKNILFNAFVPDDFSERVLPIEFNLRDASVENEYLG